jgi:hypothetical protein
MSSRAFVFMAALVPSLLRASPPALTDIAPRGLERGRWVEITLQGTNLTPQTRLHLPFDAEQLHIPDAKPTPAQTKLRVHVPAAVPVGVYPVRAVSEGGISGIVWLAVDLFPNIMEGEDNNTPEKAQPLTPPVVVNGQCAGGDVDFFRFRAKQGQRLVIETEAARLGSGVVPQLRLTDERLRFLASDDSQSIQGDCRLIFDPPADGDYLLEFSDSRYRGGNPPFYRIKIGAYDVIEELFPLGGRQGEPTTFTFSAGTLVGDLTCQRALRPAASFVNLEGLPWRPGALPPAAAVGDYPERLWHKGNTLDPRRLDIVAPVTINSRLEHPGDIDRLQMPVRPGEKYRFRLEAAALGSRLDGVLRITDQAGKQLALVDDVDIPPRLPGEQPVRSIDPVAEVSVPADAALLVAELRDQRKRGGINFGYRLTVEPAAPDVLIELPTGELNVPRGGTALLSVLVTRRGYPGPIRLSIPDLPAGYTVQEGFVPTGATAGLLTVTASNAPLIEPHPFHVEAVALDPTAGNLKRLARHTMVLNRDPAAPGLMRTFNEGLLASTPANAFAVRGPTAFQLVLGYAAKVPVTLTPVIPGPPVAAEVTILPAGVIPGQPPPPTSITSKQANASANDNQVALIVTALTSAPEGLQTLVVQAKAKVANIDQVVFAAALTVNVVRPFTIEPAGGPITLIPGQTVPVRFKLTRRDIFREPVRVQLSGLPAGMALAAPPAPVPPDQPEAMLNLKLDAKAAPATANLVLSASATINGQTYNHPPVTVPAVVKQP